MSSNRRERNLRRAGRGAERGQPRDEEVQAQVQPQAPPDPPPPPQGQGARSDVEMGAAGAGLTLLQVAERGYLKLQLEYDSRLDAATTDQQKDAVHDRYQPMLKEAHERLKDREKAAQLQQQQAHERLKDREKAAQLQQQQGVKKKLQKIAHTLVAVVVALGFLLSMLGSKGPLSPEAAENARLACGILALVYLFVSWLVEMFVSV